MLPSIFRDNLFDDMFDFDDFDKEFNRMMRPLYGKHAQNMMKTDVKELEDCYELDVDLPGFQKDEVNVSVQDGYLTIQAFKNLDRDNSDKKGRYIRQERFSGSCSRSFYVGDVQPKDVSAKYEDGILKISLPKQAPKQLPQSTLIAIE